MVGKTTLMSPWCVMKVTCQVFSQHFGLRLSFKFSQRLDRNSLLKELVWLVLISILLRIWGYSIYRYEISIVHIDMVFIFIRIWGKQNELWNATGVGFVESSSLAARSTALHWGTSQYLKVPQSTSKYLEVPQSTRSTSKYNVEHTSLLRLSLARYTALYSRMFRNSVERNYLRNSL